MSDPTNLDALVVGLKSPNNLKEVVTKIPRLRTVSRIPKGPKEFRQPVEYTGGPGKPPPG